METVLGWIGLVIGGAGTALGGFAGAKDAERKPLPLMAAGAALIGALVVFLLTRPVAPPFSVGQQLGYGALIGGVLGIIVGLIILRVGEGSAWSEGLARVTGPSAAVFGLSLTLLIFGAYPTAAVSGFIIGALISGVIFRLAVPDSESMDLWTVSSVLLGAATLLAGLRYDTIDARVWWRAPMMIMLAAVIAHVAASVVARPGRSYTVPAAAASLITLGLTAVFSWKVFPDWSLFWVAAIGVVTFALIAWLSTFKPGESPASAATALLVIALSVLTYKMMAGFGVGIALAAAFCVLLPSAAWSRKEEDEPAASSVLIYAVFIGLGLLFFRLFAEVYAADLRGIDLRAYYTLMAVAIGAVFPFVMPAFFPLPDYRSAGWRVVGSGVAGIFAAATPLVILTIWGFKAALGFLIGTVAAQVFLLLVRSTAEFRDKLSLASLTTAAQASAVLLSSLVAPLAEEPRATRAIVLGVVIVIGIIWAGVSALVVRKTVREG